MQIDPSNVVAINNKKKVVIFLKNMDYLRTNAQEAKLKQELEKNERLRSRLVDRFRFIYDTVKKNLIRHVYLSDQTKRLTDGISSVPIVVPDNLLKVCWPEAMFPYDSEYVDEHDKLIIDFQKKMITLSIKHYDRSMNAINKENFQLRNNLIEFDDFRHVKAEFKLKCTNIDEFFNEMYKIAETAVRENTKTEISETFEIFSDRSEKSKKSIRFSDLNSSSLLSRNKNSKSDFSLQNSRASSFKQSQAKSFLPSTKSFLPNTKSSIEF